MNLMIKFAGVFAVLGLIISLTFGFLAGNGWTAVLLTGFVCTALSGGLGVGVLKVLEIRVPEFLRLFEGGMVLDEENAPDLADFENEGQPLGEGELGGVDDEVATPKGAESKQFGDHILVNKVKIKNEPKLMAEAIKTMLARDDDG